MGFSEKLRELATRGGSMPYLLGSWAQVNVLADKVDLAVRKEKDKTVCIQLSSLTGAVSLFPQGTDRRDVTIGYARRIRLDYDAAAVEGVIDALRGEVFAFLSRVNADGYFEPVADADYSVLYDKTDANYIVVLLTFALSEAAGRCYE